MEDRVGLRKSETTLDGDDKLLPLWKGPFAITARLRENTWKIRVDVKRKMELSGDRLKREIPSRKGRVQPLFWTSKFLSDQVIEGGKYELKKIHGAQRDEKGEWKFLCERRGFDSTQNNWELAHSFVHGCTKGFIDFLKKLPEIGVLLTDGIPFGLERAQKCSTWARNGLIQVVCAPHSFSAPFESLSSTFQCVPRSSLKSPRRCSFPHQLGPNIQSWLGLGLGMGLGSCSCCPATKGGTG